MLSPVQLRLGAEAGDPRAQFALAQTLLIGSRTPAVWQEALHWTNAACAQNNADALLLNAVLATLGIGRARDIADAYQFVSRAAAAGSVSAKGQLAVLSGPDGFDSASWSVQPQLKTYFTKPRIFSIENLIPRKACAWLIKQGRRRLQTAPVYTDTAGLAVRAERTNSCGGFRSLEPDIVLQLTNLRIADASGVPVAYQEASNILHYARGQEYVPHFDFFSGEQLQTYAQEIAQTGQRVGTLLIYLNEDYEGGETEFPRLDWRFRGKTGDALLFWSASAQAQLEPGSLHAGLPVTKGEKWVLSKWIRTKPFPLS